MSENKKNKQKLDFTCCYCGHKANIEQLKTLGYVEEIKVGLVITCPSWKCSAEQLIK